MTRSAELGFTWCARQDTARSRPYPYTILARFNPANRQLIAQHEVYNTTFAWLYPAVAVNRSGNLALLAGFGGGSEYPGTSAVIFDELNTNYQGFNFAAVLARSNAGPANNFWGYFLTARPHTTAPNTFVAATYYLNGGGAAANVVPRYVRFGRERDFLTCGLTAITAGQTVNGSLTSGDCLSLVHRGVAPGAPFTRADRYSFTGASGQRLALRLKPTGYSAYLTLFAPAETVLAESDYENPGVEVRLPETSGFLTLPAAGRYVVEVAGYDPNDTGAYTLDWLTEVAAAAHVSAASFSAQLSGDAIAAAFGNNLATGVAVANTLPLPTTLLGTTVKVRDSQGGERLAPLFFVAPTQVNYLVPAGSAPGAATITITSGNGALAQGAVPLSAVAPGLFSANASGQGVAAAVALRVAANGAQSYEPVARFDTAQNRLVAVPVDLGLAGEQVFLILFGTGLRGRSSLAAASVNVGGLNLPVLFAGGVEGLAGLDQVNFAALPRNLAGRGVVEITVILDGKTSNVVQAQIK